MRTSNTPAVSTASASSTLSPPGLLAIASHSLVNRWGLLTAELTVPDAWVVVREADEELSFCCVVEKVNEGAGKLALLASGASSDQHHACTRAISEFVQCFVLTDAAERSEDHKVLKFLSTVKKLKPLITLETIEDFPRSRLKSLVPCDNRNVSQILASVVR